MAVNQLKAGALLSYVVLALSNIVGLLYTPYMLRMMGKSEYGLYALVASVIAYLTILDFGFANAIVRYTAKFRAEGRVSEQNSMFGMFIVLYSAVGIITFIIGLGLYYNVDILFGGSMTIEELRKAKIMVLLMVFNIAFTFPLSIFGSIITAYEDFIFQRIVQIARIILNTIVMVVILELGYRAVGMVVVATIFNLATLLLNFGYCKLKIGIKISFRKIEWGFLREVAFYSFFIFLNIIMDRIYWSSGQFVLGVYLGTAAVAVFAVAIQLQSMYMGFSLAISGVFLPKITAMVAQNKTNKEISDLFIRTGRIQYIVMAFILTGFIVFGRQFVVLWAGSGYQEAYQIALMFFIALTIPLIQSIGITILQARNQMKFRSILYIIIALCSLALQIPLAKKYGGVGSAIGISASLFLGHVIIMNIYYHRKQNLNIPKFWNEILRMSVVPIFTGLTFYGLMIYFSADTIAKLCLGIFVFAAFYIPFFWFLSMNSYERKLVKLPVANFIKKLIK